jgi:hypothetical protein
VSRLANGNTLINNWVGDLPTADWPTVVQVIEVTPDKKVVWALRDWSILGPASCTQLLDQPGIAEKRELQRQNIRTGPLSDLWLLCGAKAASPSLF